MIVGVGNDVIELARIKEAVERGSFKTKIFTPEEIAISKDRISFYAGNFAVKEAIAKALGTGFRTFMPIDIEVLRDDKGKPVVNLYANALHLAREKKVHAIHVSISDTKESAFAFAVLEQREDIIPEKIDDGI